MNTGSTRWGVVAVAILLLALGVRLVHLDYDLPAVYEEATPARVAWRLGENGTLNPEFFRYPTLVIYANALVQEVGRSVRGETPEDVDRDPTWVILAGRALSVAFGVATVLATILLGRATGGGAVGLIAGLWLALVPAHVTVSRTILVDGPAACFGTFALWMFTRPGVRVTRALMWGGALVGLSASSKYPGAAFGVGAIVRAAEARRTPPTRILALLFGAGAIAMLVFAGTSPYVWLDFDAFRHDFMLEREHMARGHFGLDPTGALGAYAALAWDNLGVIAALVVAGTVAGLTRSGAPRGIAVTSLAIGAMMVTWSMFAANYAALLWPAWLVLAAWGSVTASRAIAERVGAPGGAPTFMAVGALALAVPLAIGTAQDATALGRPHTRGEAAAWVREHLAEDALVAAEHHSVPDTLGDCTVIRIPLSTFDPDAVTGMYDLRWYDGVDAFVVSDGVAARFESEPDRFEAPVGFYARLRDEFDRAASFGDSTTRGPGIEVFVRRARDAADVPVPADFERALAPVSERSRTQFIERLGHGLLAKGRTRRAESVYRAGTRSVPGNELFWYNAGALSVVRGDFDGAVTALERAIAIDPSRAEAHNNLGIAYANLGRTNEAAAAFETALGVDPAHPSAERNLVRLRENLKER
jgi:hypothetical protein